MLYICVTKANNMTTLIVINQVIENNKKLIEKELKKSCATLESLIPFLENCNFNSDISPKQIGYLFCHFRTQRRTESLKKSNMFVYGKEKVSLKEKIQFHTSK